MDSYAGYKELAYRIALIACVDYVDSLIVRKRGYLTKKGKLKIEKKIWKEYLEYGSYRLYNAEGKLTSIKERRKMIRKLKNAIEIPQNMKNQAKAEAQRLEDWFHDRSFAIFMPDIEPDDLIRKLKGYARANKRLPGDYYQTIYPY